MNQNLIDKLQKYEDLVKYARTNPENLKFPLIQELMNRVESSYQEEVENLRSIDADWHHGFNSGCLAILRYIDTLESHGKEAADLEFPMLDT